MRYSRAACFLAISLLLVLSIQTSARADDPDQKANVANKPTTFLLFNTTPGGTYQVQKNSSQLATLTASFSGVLRLFDSVTPGDQFLFIPDGVNLQPPLPPQGVSLAETSPGCVTVSWQANSEPDIAGYVIYYDTMSVDGVTKLTYSDSLDVGNATSRQLCGFADGTYYFAVKAYNLFGLKSGYSQEESIDLVLPNQDVTPPTVSITGPASGDAVSGDITVSAAANDNVGVAGVRFQLDGNDLGAEDTQSPFEANFQSPSVSDGSHTLTAIARDDAGNTATSTAAIIFVDNDSDPDHPALHLGGGLLAALRAKACLDANGDPVPGCQPSAEWVTFESHMSAFADGGTYPGMEAWHFALAYKVTKDERYAARAGTIVDSEIADGMSAERSANYAQAHVHLKNVAVVYDWVHPFLNSTQETAFIGYMNQLLTEIWDPTGNPFNTWTGDGTENPGSYRYYELLLGTAYAALATETENTNPPTLSFGGDAYNNVIDFVTAKLDQQALPDWLETNGAGGAWHEGDAGGVKAKTAMFELFALLEADGRPDYFATTLFPSDALFYHLYSIQPGEQVRYPGGDLTGDPTGPVGDGDRLVMLLLARGLAGEATGEFGQHWLGNVYTAMQSLSMYAWDLLLVDSSLPSTDYSGLTPNYAAQGLGWINSRSGWGANDVSLSFVCGDKLQDAQHLDQNSFVIYHDGWQAGDAGSFSATGMLPPTDLHNTIIVDGQGQRTGAGTGAIVKYEFDTDYAYMVGDASDAYNSVSTRLLDTFQREIVHLVSEYIIVFDRVTTVDPAAAVIYALNTKNQPSVSGAEVSAVTGGGKIFQKTMLPDTPSIATVRENGGPNGLDSWRVEVQAPIAASANRNFLNVLYPTSASTTTMPDAIAVYTATGNMVGVKITHGAEDLVVMFSTDPTGAPPSGGVLYDVGANTTSEHMLLGLVPEMEYAVQTSDKDGVRTVSVSPGAGYRASSSGVLKFRLEKSKERVLAMR